jgi:hypothetical protein
MQDVEGEPGPFDMVFDMGEGKPVKKILFDKPDLEPTNAIKEELFTFYQAIVNDTTPIVPIEDGYLALDIAQKIVDKLKSASSQVLNNI